LEADIMAERIYITEDDDSIRELVTVALSAYSYEVESFVSAEDCLAATEKQVPDIFLFDIMLPGMDGVQAVKILISTDCSAYVSPTTPDLH
jgi:two-component system alkaline phosphatase synthesis response regulator PhoP